MNSGAALENRTIRLVGERPAVPMEGQPMPPPSPVMAPIEPAAMGDRLSTPSNAHYHQQMIATLEALAMVLSARIPAVLGVIGAFVLALLSILEPSNTRIYLTVAFDGLVLIPSIMLYWWKG